MWSKHLLFVCLTVQEFVSTLLSSVPVFFNAIDSVCFTLLRVLWLTQTLLKLSVRCIQKLAMIQNVVNDGRRLPG